jgi:hypothetical protein
VTFSYSPVHTVSTKVFSYRTEIIILHRVCGGVEMFCNTCRIGQTNIVCCKGIHKYFYVFSLFSMLLFPSVVLNNCVSLLLYSCHRVTKCMCLYWKCMSHYWNEVFFF